MYDFLSSTANVYYVYVPERGRFIEKLGALKKHLIKPYSNVKSLYVKIFFGLLSGSYKTVYCNEGGHIRYIKVLARLFGSKKFVVHIRISEDTEARRLANLPPNIILVAISAYIAQMIPSPVNSSVKMIHDPYVASAGENNMRLPGNKIIKAAVIGRITGSKGLKEMQLFADFLEENKTDDIELNFYGETDSDDAAVSSFVERTRQYRFVKIFFHGFVAKETIYKGADLVVHFSTTEPLGRIFLEALDYCIPFIGFMSGGIGEIASLLGLEDCMIVPGDDWQRNMVTRMREAEISKEKYQLARRYYLETFSATDYTKRMEEIISS